MQVTYSIDGITVTRKQLASFIDDNSPAVGNKISKQAEKRIGVTVKLNGAYADALQYALLQAAFEVEQTGYSAECTALLAPLLSSLTALEGTELMERAA